MTTDRSPVTLPSHSGQKKSSSLKVAFCYSAWTQTVPQEYQPKRKLLGRASWIPDQKVAVFVWPSGAVPNLNELQGISQHQQVHSPSHWIFVPAPQNTIQYLCTWQFSLNQADHEKHSADGIWGRTVMLCSNLPSIASSVTDRSDLCQHSLYCRWHFLCMEQTRNSGKAMRCFMLLVFAYRRQLF